MLIKRGKANILIAAILCLLFVGLTATNAFGSAWIGDAGPGSGGGGGGHKDCKNKPITYNSSDCNGAVWVYYQYNPSSGLDGQSIQFEPGKSGRVIPGDCARSDKPAYGFWHLGFYAEFGGRLDPLTAGYVTSSSHGYQTAWTAEIGTAVTTSHGTLRFGWMGATFYRSLGKVTTLGHKLLKDGQVMYEASIYGPDWNTRTDKNGKNYSVEDAYKKTVALYNEIYHDNISDTPGDGLWAFCSTPDGDDGQGANINGTITATIDGSAVANDSRKEVTSDVTVINYTDTVYTTNNTTHSVNVCYSGSDNSGGQSNYNSCYYYTPSATTNSQYPAITINTPEGMSDIQVCHYLDHPTTIGKDGTVSGSKRETHCVTLYRKKPDPGSCGDMGISYTDYVAYTDAQMIFRFNDKSTTLGYSGEGNSKTYWAKPGDNVQYEYKMCGSSEYARTASHDEPAKGFSASDVPKFDLSANKNGSNNSAYLFGHTPTSYTNSNMTNYYVGFTSPDKTLACSMYQGAKASKSKFYQIPAESGASCDASKVAEYSDVGSTFEQKLSYRKISTKQYSVKYTDYYYTYSCNQYGCTAHRHTYTYYQYGTELASSSNQTLTGTVKVPYNYALVPYMKHTNNDGITYAGASFSTQAFIATIPRVNKQVQDTAYATRTKNTKIIVASFTMTGSSLPISDGKSSTSSAGLTADTVCRVAGAGSYSNCKSVYESTNVLNTTSTMLKGSSDESSSISAGGSSVNGSISAEVPYVVPGTKFCVAVGVSPSDSHNTGNNSAINSDNQSAALSSSGSGYRVGPPACVTVAKKPTFSVESSQLVTNGSVKTSITNANGRVYGSWSEYGIVSSGSVSNMGSGAAYGYTSPYYNIATAGFGANKGTTGAGLPKSTASPCANAPQTFGNEGCSQGGATIIRNSVDSMAVAKKVDEIYHMTKAEMSEGYKTEYGIIDIADASNYYRSTTRRKTIPGSSKSFVNFTFGSTEACRYSSGTGRYIAPSAYSAYYPDAYAIVGGTRVAPVYCTATGEKYWKSSTDTYMTGTSSALSKMQMGGSGTSDLDHTTGAAKETYRNPVYVIDVDGTLVIDVNIEASNGSSGDRFQAIDQIPTAIIIAKEVIITDRVERLDAWIIAGLHGGSGKVNTCGAVGYYGKIIETEDLTSNTCTTPLQINGAIYAKEIVLNRTYGGGGQSGDGESTIKARFAQRGEIFNLRSDAYYWAYYQSQRNRILTTVYARELPTRY